MYAPWLKLAAIPDEQFAERAPVIAKEIVDAGTFQPTLANALAAKTLTSTLHGYRFNKRLSTGKDDEFVLLFSRGEKHDEVTRPTSRPSAYTGKKSIISLSM